MNNKMLLNFRGFKTFKRASAYTFKDYLPYKTVTSQNV